MADPTKSEAMAEIAAQIARNPIDKSVERFEVDVVGKDIPTQFRAVVRCAHFDSYEDAALAAEVIARMIRGTWT